MKQYLLLVDDHAKALLQSLCAGLQFLEVQGFNLNGENKFQVLATPVNNPVTPIAIETPKVSPEQTQEIADV